jgi:hypothetical protein
LRRVSIVVVLAVCVSAVLGVAGCAAVNPNASASPTETPLSAMDVIQAAVAASTSIPSHVTESQTLAESTLRIYADLGTGTDRIRYEWNQPNQPAFIAIGEDFFYRTDPAAAKPWLHLEKSKLSMDSHLPALIMSPGLALLHGVVEAQRVSALMYEGTIDLRKAYQDSPIRADRAYVDHVRGGASGATTGMKFTVTIENGRIILARYELKTITLDALITYSPDMLVEAPPPDQIREALAADYKQW